MARQHINDSRATYIGGRDGMIYGAIGGALLVAAISLVFALLDISIGGPGVSVIAGMAFGGLAGLMFGALRARHGYQGPDRRLRLAPYAGQDRRTLR